MRWSLPQTIVAACVVSLLTASNAIAGPITVRPGDTLTFSFTTNPANFFPNDPPDYLEFSFFGAITKRELDDQGHIFGDTVVSLYDGDTLLSRHNNGFALSDVVFGAGMERPSEDAIDFRSILDGTIQGRFELQTTTKFTLNPDLLAPWPGVLLWDVLPPGGWGAAESRFNWVTVTDIGVTRAHPGQLKHKGETPVPEPATLLLLGTGLAGLGIFRRKRPQTLP